MPDKPKLPKAVIFCGDLQLTVEDTYEQIKQRIDKPFIEFTLFPHSKKTMINTMAITSFRKWEDQAVRRGKA